MKLSILIVNYKSDEYIQDCLDSIEKQSTTSRFEILIHDNNENNIGFGRGNNEIAKQAKGEYLLLLNPDTILLSDDTLQKLIDYMDSHTEAGVVGPRLIDKEGVYQTSAGKRHSWYRMILEKPFSLIYRKWGDSFFILKLLSLFSSRYDFESERTNCDVVTAAALLVRRELFEKVGGFDDAFFMYFEDDDLCLRIKALGYEVHFYPAVTIRHLVGKSENDSDAKDAYYYENQDIFFKKHGSKIEQSLVKLFRWPYKALRLRRLLNRYF